MTRVTKTCDYNIRRRSAQPPRPRREKFSARLLKFSTRLRPEPGCFISYRDIFCGSAAVYHSPTSGTFRFLVSSSAHRNPFPPQPRLVIPPYAITSARNLGYVARDHASRLPLLAGTEQRPRVPREASCLRPVTPVVHPEQRFFEVFVDSRRHCRGD